LKSALKHIVARTYKPLLVKYLSKTRVYTHENIRLEIAPQVFHPGFFFSTRLLLNYLKGLPLKNKNFLELGCGSGLISLYAQKKGANVTATDINPTAVEYLRKNSARNNASITIILSDLFQDIPVQTFDIIAINPPYYKKNPVSAQDYAWCCGENGEYFEALFKQLNKYLHPGSGIFMVLFDGCDMGMIETLATQNGFGLDCMLTRKNLLEKNFIYKITMIK
jgi:release factor glutamine methyltransferase